MSELSTLVQDAIYEDQCAIDSLNMMGYSEIEESAEALCREIERLEKQIAYWSYCTRMGMHQYCPEKSEELREFHLSCGVDPA